MSEKLYPKAMYLSIIIPAYNEEKRIKDTLIKVGGFLSQQNYDYEIIVVNDGSSDKTSDVVNQLKAQIKNIYLIQFEEIINFFTLSLVYETIRLKSFS